MNPSSVQNDLFMRVQGEGDTIVLLHGWGMHSGVWDGFAEALSSQYQVVCIDLPGHGRSRGDCALTLDAVVAAVLGQVQGAVHWIGWSLGGSVLLQLVKRAPERVKSFVLLSASPAFVRTETWLHGIEAQVLSRFADDLRVDYKKTLQRFLALQTLSSQTAKANLRQLREVMFSVPDPDVDCLMQGLHILQQADLREVLQRTQLRGLVILGQQDQLVPASLANYYRGLACQPKVVVLSGGGHAVFLSHPAETLNLVTVFIASDNGCSNNE